VNETFVISLFVAATVSPVVGLLPIALILLYAFIAGGIAADRQMQREWRERASRH
jgi:hypothetical protein